MDWDSCSEEDGVIFISAGIFSLVAGGVCAFFGGLVVLLVDVGGRGRGRATYVAGSAATFATTMEYLLSCLVLQ